ncbi:hypothetical protein ACQ5SO_05140 [Rhodovulum sp. DZ06]|uniref:hypothetical protein n=1 Tax=Rhodovulum sp. DZ06 TaxID=3425126 RepID=UPI003D3370AD
MDHGLAMIWILVAGAALAGLRHVLQDAAPKARPVRIRVDEDAEARRRARD